MAGRLRLQLLVMVLADDALPTTTNEARSSDGHKIYTLVFSSGKVLFLRKQLENIENMFSSYN